MADFKTPTILSGVKGGTHEHIQHTMYDDLEVNIFTHNNEWLRCTAYKFLFMFQVRHRMTVSCSYSFRSFISSHEVDCRMACFSDHAFRLFNIVKVQQNGGTIIYPCNDLPQGAGLVAVNLAAYGFARWNVFISLLGLASAFLGPQAKRMTFMAWGQPAFPLSLNVRLPAQFASACCCPARCRCWSQVVSEIFSPKQLLPIIC